MIKPIAINGISFGYSNILKTYWKQGQLPQVKKGFYGDTLTKKNITLEHLKPHCEGGATRLDNLVLASQKNNQARANFPLSKFFNKELMEQYLEQFKGINLPKFNGDEYILLIKKTVESLIKKG